MKKLLSLTLALLESIKRNGGIDCADIMDNFVKWLDDGAFTPYGYAYDIGRGTINAIRKYKRDHKPHEAGSTAEKNSTNKKHSAGSRATFFTSRGMVIKA